MKQYIPVIIVIAVIVVYWVCTFLYKKYLSDQIVKAMEMGDTEAYQKLLFSKRALMFLNPDNVMLLRAISNCAAGKFEEAEKNIKVVRFKKLKPQDKLSYFQAMSTLALSKKDAKLNKRINEELYKFYEESQLDLIQALIKENEINQKLYFEYDNSVIEDLRDMIDTADGTAKGIMMLSLAKAYHLNQQDGEAEKVLKEAAQLLVDTPYAELAEKSLETPSLMD